jgi:HrpA-like RNA helicase
MAHTGGAPTLLRPGNLREVRRTRTGAPLSPPQAELDDLVPITFVLNWFREHRSGLGPLSRVLVFRSSTGSGKSTVLPPELYHAFFERDPRDIACTQPRVLTSREMIERVIPFHSAEALRAAGRSSLEPLVLERNIGFQTGSISRKPIRGIIYMTVGVLMRQLTVMTDEEICRKYGFIIIDEAHERSMEVDNSLYLLRQLLLRQANNPHCPFVVVMSATMDPFLMADYLLREEKERYRNIIDVAGYTEPIKEHFLELTSPDLVLTTAERVLAIHEEDRAGLSIPTRDILVFGAGEMELKSIRQRVEGLLRERVAKDKFYAENALLPITLTRKQVQAADAEYRSVFAELKTLKAADASGQFRLPVARRVVFATNVAETGVTIETLGHVIDTGLYKSNEFNPVHGCMLLVTKPITRFMYAQRRGRVGRVAPGNCYAMYTRETLDQLDEDRPPSMLVSDITAGLLTFIVRQCDRTGEFMGFPNDELLLVPTKKTGGGSKTGKVAKAGAEFLEHLRATAVDLSRMDLLTPPPADLLQFSLERLYVLGLVNENSCPTPLGWLASQMDKISVENSCMILAAYAWGACPLDLITIAAMLEREAEPLPAGSQAGTAYDQWVQLSGGDHLLLLLWSFTQYQGQLGSFKKHREIRRPYGGCDDGVYAFSSHRGAMGGDEEGGDDLVAGGWEGKKKDNKAKKGQKGKKDKEASQKASMSESDYHEVAKTRDQYIDNLVRLGFNPFLNWERSVHAAREDRGDLISYFALLKQCIWEGYKLNLAEWGGEQYTTRRTRIPLAGPYLGRFALFVGLQYRRKQFTPAGFVPLDGYIPVDPNFIFH